MGQGSPAIKSLAVSDTHFPLHCHIQTICEAPSILTNGLFSEWKYDLITMVTMSQMCGEQNFCLTGQLTPAYNTHCSHYSLSFHMGRGLFGLPCQKGINQNHPPKMEHILLHFKLAH